MLVSSLQAFDGEERDEVVEILCGRINWADTLLSGIENGRIQIIDFSLPCPANQISKE